MLARSLPLYTSLFFSPNFSHFNFWEPFLEIKINHNTHKADMVETRSSEKRRKVPVHPDEDPPDNEDGNDSEEESRDVEAEENVEISTNYEEETLGDMTCKDSNKGIFSKN